MKYFEKISKLVPTAKKDHWSITDEKGKKIGKAYIKSQHVNIFINKKYQNKGYGAKALKELVSKSDNKKLYATIRKSNLPSIRIAQKANFKITANKGQIKMKHSEK